MVDRPSAARRFRPIVSGVPGRHRVNSELHDEPFASLQTRGKAGSDLPKRHRGVPGALHDHSGSDETSGAIRHYPNQAGVLPKLLIAKDRKSPVGSSLHPHWL
jgi:hypothetical protein